MELDERGKVILVVDDSECGRIATERLVSLAKKGLRADVFIIYGVNVKILPMTPQEKEMKIYMDLGVKSSKLVEFYRDRLENEGINVEQINIIFGDILDEVLKFERLINPDLIILGVGKHNFLRGLLRSLQERLIFDTASPVLVCKAYEAKEVDLGKCAKCRL